MFDSDRDSIISINSIIFTFFTLIIIAMSIVVFKTSSGIKKLVNDSTEENNELRPRIVTKEVYDVILSKPTNLGSF